MGVEAVEIVTLVMDKFLASKNYEVRYSFLPFLLEFNTMLYVLSSGCSSNAQKYYGQKVWHSLAMLHW